MSLFIYRYHAVVADLFSKHYLVPTYVRTYRDVWVLTTFQYSSTM